jgi:hypothetical protein
MKNNNCSALLVLLSQLRDATTFPASEYKYKNPADFVLQEGEVFVPEALTESESEILRKAIGRKVLQSKVCFYNALRVMLADGTGSLHYVEGYMSHGIHHAWLAIGNKAIDVTMPPDPKREYVGVRFRKEYVLRMKGRRACVALLDDWKVGWPVLRDPSGDWRMPAQASSAASEPATSASRVPVTERALIQRINRKLAEDDMKLVKLRGHSARAHGEFVVLEKPSFADVIGWGRNGPLHSRIEQTDVDLAELAAELGVLKPGETLAAP